MDVLLTCHQPQSRQQEWGEESGEERADTVFDSSRRRDDRGGWNVTGDGFAEVTAGGEVAVNDLADVGQGLLGGLALGHAAGCVGGVDAHGPTRRAMLAGCHVSSPLSPPLVTPRPRHPVVIVLSRAGGPGYPPSRAGSA